MPGLVALLTQRWSHREIATLFDCDDLDARKVAALAFGLVGKKCCVNKLVPLLKDPDPMTSQMAEHALWSVWFRGGNAKANHELARGTRALNRRDFEHAIEHFSRAIDCDPTFSEAYNQRAIVHYLMEQYDLSIADCQRTVEHMPIHFGAWAGMGHCHAHEGNLAEAVQCYERALEINPGLEGVRQAVTELRSQLGDED